MKSKKIASIIHKSNFGLIDNRMKPIENPVPDRSYYRKLFY